MTDGSLRIKDIVIDCDDVDLVASFWSELLRRPVIARTGPYVSLDRRNGLGVVFQRTSGPKTTKNRVHLDLGSDDPPADQRRAEELGGTRVEGYGSGGFLVMADPEGNEFCVIPSEPFDVDDDGRASYL
jgi:predicted enzyme related to lactoylglutathione lyase